MLRCRHDIGREAPARAADGLQALQEMCGRRRQRQRPPAQLVGANH